jgi:hypothetical protein
MPGTTLCLSLAILPKREGLQLYTSSGGGEGWCIPSLALTAMYTGVHALLAILLAIVYQSCREQQWQIDVAVDRRDIHHKVWHLEASCRPAHNCVSIKLNLCPLHAPGSGRVT